MKKVTRSTILLSFTLALLACGTPQINDAQVVSKAPKSQSEISDSYVVMGISPYEQSEILHQNPQALSRHLGQNTYEIRGASKQSILENSPHAIVEKNYFIKQEAPPLSKEQILYEALKLEAAQEFSPRNCPSDPLLRVPSMSVSSENSDGAIEAGQKISFRVSRTRRTGATAWYVVPPLGSKINFQYDESQALELTPDMPGTYTVVLFHKKNGLCNSKVSRVTVTLNEPYNPILTEVEKEQLSLLSKQSFSQITTTEADEAQKIAQSDTETVIAVLDSGVNYNHPALKGKMWVNKDEVPHDGIDNDNNGQIDDIVGYDFENGDPMPMDDDGHGSHVAGLAAGKHIGTGGTNNIKIMALKTGSSNKFDLATLFQSTLYAIENKADIINMSLTYRNDSKIMRFIIEKAADEGVLVVAASGNGDHTGKGMNNDLTPHYPGSYELSNIITVGASKADGSLTGYSNYSRTSVDIVAVGGHSGGFDNNPLHSAYLKNPSNLLTRPSAGTSMATPIVAGVAALLIAEDSSLKPVEVKSIMMTTGKRSPYLREQIVSESMVDAKAAVNFLQRLF